MTEIFIDPNKTTLSVQITSQSMHALGFEITVFASDGNTITEQATGDTKNKNPCVIDLHNAPSLYKNGFIRGTFTAISPNGDDFEYSILFSLMEEGIVVRPCITITGTTSGGSDTTIAQFHIN